MPTLVLATNNQDKIKEIKAILKNIDVNLKSAGDFDNFPEADETGKTLKENALFKARAIWDKYHLPCLADDTGLEVDCLDGEPGVHSSRYAGESASYDDNCRKLLSVIALEPPGDRKARFRTVVVFIDQDGEAHFADGTVEGEIIDEKRGENGFGYDPLFLIPHLGKTLAELPAEEKNKISHRHNALMKILPVIKAKLVN
jgi:XTP/dITP diphosphohydrolase